MTIARADRRAHFANNFDLIRLLAALQVAVSHSFAWLQVPMPKAADETIRAFPGVAIFFVISGFLITRSWVERSDGRWTFFCNRALRIYPALWLQYVLAIILMAATGGFFASTLLETKFWSWLGYAAFVGSNFWASVLTSYTPFSYTGLYKWYPNDVLWTIPVELSFYVLVPIVFARRLTARGWAGPLAAVLLMTSIALAYYAGPLLRDHSELNTTGMWHSSPGPYFWLFAAGGLTAYYWKHVAWLFEGRAAWWALAYAALAAVNWLMAGTIALPYRIPDALTIPRGLVLAAVVIAFAHSWTWISRWMRGVDLSYGLYLFHLPLPYGLYYAGITGSIWLVVLSLAVAFAMAALSWFLVEAPALTLKRGRRVSMAQAPVSAIG